MRDLGRRPAAFPGALVLATYAGFAAMVGTRLPYIGAEYLYATAAILAGAAVCLGLGLLWGRAFALLFFVATALLYLYVAEEAGRALLADSSNAEFAQVRRLVVAGIAAIGLVGCGVSVVLASLVVYAGRGSGDGVWSHAAAWPLALAGVLAIAWMVGYEYHYRLLREQNECLSEKTGRCYGLARDARFSPSERLRFATRGCESGSLGACSLLAGMLGPAHPATSAEARVLALQCARGKADVCLRFASYLFRISERAEASRSLSFACESDKTRCSEAAKLADAQGEAPLAESVLRRGCERDDPTTCRALLRRMERSRVPEAERDALHLHVCLVTDVNECLPLIRRDAEAVCPTICEGTTENRKQSCDHCGRHATKTEKRALALAWLGGNCENGYPLSCVNLGLFLQERGEAREANRWYAKACDPARNLTLGCRYAPR